MHERSWDGNLLQKMRHADDDGIVAATAAAANANNLQLQQV